MPTAEDILNESPLAKGLSDEEKRRILAASPGAHATPQMFTGVGPFKGESAGEREQRIRQQLGAQGTLPQGVEPNQPYGTAVIPPVGAPAPAGAPAAAPAPAPAGAPAPASATGAPTPTYASIAAQRAPMMDEVNKDPATKKLLMQMMSTEGGGAATVEALFNRVAMIRQKVPGYSIKDELNSRFYGPLRSGARPEISEAQAAQYQQTLDQVGAGSNIIQGRTNQGMASDSGANAPGRIPVPGSSEVYNYWSGERGGVGFGTGASQQFAEQQQQLAAQSQPAPALTAPPPPAGGPSIAGNYRGFVTDPEGRLAGNVKQINEDVIRNLNTASAALPPGWHAKIAVGPAQHNKGTYTGGAQSQVPLGMAADIALIDPQGHELPKQVAHNAAEDAAIRASPEWQIRKQLGDAYIKASGGKGRWGGYYSLADTMQYGTVAPGYPAGARAPEQLYAAAEAQGPERALAGGGMPNGGVNVTVTHKNAPADVQVAATSYGTGLNLGATRTEHQQFGNI
jgi:hypothetical protein